MAQVDFTTAPVFRTAAPKARMTVYFAMLIIALFAMLAACLLMYLEVHAYGGFGAVPGKVTSLQRTPSAMVVTASVCVPQSSAA